MKDDQIEDGWHCQGPFLALESRSSKITNTSLLQPCGTRRVVASSRTWKCEGQYISVSEPGSQTTLKWYIFDVGIVGLIEKEDQYPSFTRLVMIVFR